ncbi:hypothetical protein TraAM80_08155 [Trypanosoma rangeli]|uniref:Uncharacterized protein n=1 Tax=Trypanosoma rangeli TaxID=5698 RepID=A0A422N223_TRYRA|nr:uncharacterized protein TraAM80_08155 [Trypanosoma rangeli]RNE99489.1 hypothetical protein TraAM80_08155 [Trypanosoma rangeli]|eukprot:RNE99489.1 hypothetical protein TraAM80_08155 [Trypanosoma rangeli]
MSPSLHGPLTLRTIVRLASGEPSSAMRRTRTCVTLPREPVRPSTLMIKPTCAWSDCCTVTSSCVAFLSFFAAATSVMTTKLPMQQYREKDKATRREKWSL